MKKGWARSLTESDRSLLESDQEETKSLSSRQSSTESDRFASISEDR